MKLISQSGNSIQSLFFGKPFIPGLNKSDVSLPNRQTQLATGRSEHAHFLSQRHHVALLILKVFDKLYSINKPDISEVAPLEQDVTRSLLPTPSEILDNMCQTSPMAYVRDVDATISYYLLKILFSF